MQIDPGFVAEIAKILEVEAMLPKSPSEAVAERLVSFVASQGASLPEAPQRVYETAGAGPFLCPVCRGVGRVLLGFYEMKNPKIDDSGNVLLEACRSCEGGIVWAPGHA
jgi:hypothetical protein